MESSYMPVIVKWSPPSVPQLSPSLSFQAPAGSPLALFQSLQLVPLPAPLASACHPPSTSPLFKSLYKEKPLGLKLSQKIRTSEPDFEEVNCCYKFNVTFRPTKGDGLDRQVWTDVCPLSLLVHTQLSFLFLDSERRRKKRSGSSVAAVQIFNHRGNSF